MYNILQLREKDQDELRAIATNMGIKDAKSLNRDKLVYAILDEQAISASSSRQITANLRKPKGTMIPEEEEGQKRISRFKIHQTSHS